jgi:hypothetical protein
VWVRGLTLPDASPVDEDLDRVGGVEGLVVVEDEYIATQSMDTARVHCCILEYKKRQKIFTWIPEVIIWQKTRSM